MVMAKWAQELVWVARDDNGVVVRMQEDAPEGWIGKLVPCDWCGEEVEEVSHPHTFDMAPGKKMCRRCWDHDREVYKGSYGEDIGPFRPIKGVK